jgi:hypothetical protein
MRGSVFLAAILALVTLSSFAEDAAIEVGGSATVMIREQHVFPSPVFYAQPVGELAFGSVVDVLEQQGDWYSIRADGGTTGWVHATSLTGAVLSEGSQGTDDNNMIMLAGRGFNSDVENSYASEKNLPWNQVDAIEAITVEPSVVQAFLAQGFLLEGGSQ